MLVWLELARFEGQENRAAQYSIAYAPCEYNKIEPKAKFIALVVQFLSWGTNISYNKRKNKRMNDNKTDEVPRTITIPLIMHS